MTMTSDRPSTRRGRPPGITGPIKPPYQAVVVRVRAPMDSLLDEWRGQQLDRPTRGEAMKRLAAQALAEFLKQEL
jgi:hypothetical protein